jgi:hypothetical protein
MIIRMPGDRLEPFTVVVSIYMYYMYTHKQFPLSLLLDQNCAAGS